MGPRIGRQTVAGRHCRCNPVLLKHLAQMCGSDGGSRVSIAGGGAMRSGVHRGHGDGGRRKRTWCETPTLFDAYFAERLGTGTSETHVLVTVGDGQ